ncbi:MAG: flagellar L-ring protein precursor FlgH [Phenylobacterium sp.]|jgi:flagellar L-ring protein precursor FlgH
MRLLLSLKSLIPVRALAVAFTGVVLLSGCAVTEPTRQQDSVFFEPVVPEQPDDQIVPTGSLFRKAMASSLYSDSKARRVGDIITIELDESTQASKKAKNEYDSETANTVNPITGLGGLPINFDKKAIQFGLNSSNDFSGNAKADQSNSLSGSISVNVLRVYPNGNLMIRGEKWIELNTGREFIRLSGVIRQEDIGSDNTITSTKVANARIEYSGTGDFHKGQQAGWLSQFFTSKWWPF